MEDKYNEHEVPPEVSIFINEDERELKIFFVPYTDAFEFAEITEIIRKTLSDNNVIPFLKIEKVHVVHHKKLGIPITHPYGIYLRYPEKYENVMKRLFRKRFFTIYHQSDILYNKDVVPIVCEKYHTMDDLIRKKGI